MIHDPSGVDVLAAQPPAIDFLIIGAQKAGTSWLHARLREQPGFWLPPDKDYEFFSYPGASAPEAFRSRFAAAPRSARVGDACASYLWTTGRSESNPRFAGDLPGNIDAALGPYARFIVLLRDPVDRAVSAYLHHLAFGSLTDRVPLLDAPDALGLIDIGRYGIHLDAWCDRVGGDRLCVLPAPGEVAPAEVLLQVVQFLGGETITSSPGSDAPVFEGLPRRCDDLGVWIPADAPGLERRRARTVDEEGRAWIRVIDREALQGLEAMFAEDRARLKRALQRVGGPSLEIPWLADAQN
jgi:hypothetical protein